MTPKSPPVPVKAGPGPTLRGGVAPAAPIHSLEWPVPGSVTVTDAALADRWPDREGALAAGGQPIAADLVLRFSRALAGPDSAAAPEDASVIPGAPLAFRAVGAGEDLALPGLPGTTGFTETAGPLEAPLSGPVLSTDHSARIEVQVDQSGLPPPPSRVMALDHAPESRDPVKEIDAFLASLMAAALGVAPSHSPGLRVDIANEPAARMEPATPASVNATASLGFTSMRGRDGSDAPPSEAVAGSVDQSSGLAPRPDAENAPSPASGLSPRLIQETPRTSLPPGPAAALIQPVVEGEPTPGLAPEPAPDSISKPLIPAKAKQAEDRSAPATTPLSDQAAGGAPLGPTLRLQVATSVAQPLSATPPDRTATALAWQQVQAVAERMSVGMGPSGVPQVRLDIDPRLLPGVQATIQVLAGQVHLEFVCATDQVRRRLRTVAHREIEGMAARVGMPVLVTLRSGDWSGAEDGVVEDEERMHAGA